MDWIRRNLFYVTWGGLALALTALACLFWYSGYRRNAELDEKLAAERQQLEALLRANPRPTPENVQRVQEDTARIQARVAEARKLFRPPLDSRLDAASFRKLLDDSIYDLNQRASAAHVTVPPNFNYSFSAQRVAVTFAPGSINRLAARLADVKSLCQILFDARVYSVDSLRRSSASEDEALTSPDLLVAKPVTNAVTGLVRYPYEVVFTGFTRELARVIEGLNRSTDFYVIRNIAVAGAPPPAAPAAAAGLPGQMMAPRFSPSPGNFPRPGAPPARPPSGDPDNPDEPDMAPEDPEMAAPAPAAPRSPTFRPATSDTVLDEQLLQFTLTVDLIRAPAVARP
jgi:hypothetical protein